MTGESTLQKGARYIGTVTGAVGRERVYLDVEFSVSRDQEPEPFVRHGGATPDQDRVFVVDPFGHGSVPSLFVAGSIRQAEVAS